ncbi:MAG: helix-turn-helix transcriptional regulator [Lachnospiraceae bacterium]|nr:helix-turn-helix transcriptional regulator [Lachnospiraceae bacterium]
MRKADLARKSGVPYSTVSDIVNGKTRIETCSASVVYKISKTLDVTMEDLVAPHCEKRPEFEWFKSEACHALKREGDTKFILNVLESNNIFKFYEWEWYPEAFYLLAMVDYLSRVNDIEWCCEFDTMRHQKVDPPIYPSGIIAVAAALGNEEEVKRKAREGAIPEFMRHGIVEGDVRDAV